MKDFSERVRVDGTAVERKEIIDFVAQHKNYFETHKSSFFEMTVGLAFDRFAFHQVDVAIIEVGLGGRLDATNIITPVLSVITNIGLDHTQFLGDSRSAIAREKAGIIKNKIPILIGEKDIETQPVFEEVAKIAKHSADETINQMDLLKQANVIDSGAYGLSVMLEAANNCLELDDNGNVKLKLDGTYSFIPTIPEEQNFNKEFFQDSSHDDWGYCVVYAISGNKLDSENIKSELSDKGRSLVVSGSDSVCKVHIHAEKPDEILEFSKKFGEISNENISNMDEQFDEMKNNVSQKFKAVSYTHLTLPTNREV